jgi:rubredoxin-NAD+ reductase
LPIERLSVVPFISVNNMEDYQHFRQTIEGKRRVAIVGAGFVGCELACDLKIKGYEVDVIDKGQWPLQQVIPEVMGSAIRRAMADAGVNWHFGTTIESASHSGFNAPQDAQIRIRLSNGTLLETDVILSAVGLRPEISLAVSAGIETGQGIIVDEFLRTSVTDIYAVGDCVQYAGTALPFMAPATQGAKALGKTLTGKPTALLMPSLAVTVKIPPCPTVIWPSVKSKGVWEVQGAGLDLEAHLLDEHGNISGFALTGSCVGRKNELTRACMSAPVCLASNSHF